jgi:hypothetical protein
MTLAPPNHDSGWLEEQSSQPLIGVIHRRDGQEITTYFTDEAAATSPDSGPEHALRLLGAWKDLDWQDALMELDRR